MGIMFVTSTHLALPPFLLPSPLPPVTELLSIMSLKGMSKKEQHQVLVACGLDYTLASSAAASETGPSPPLPPFIPPPVPPTTPIPMWGWCRICRWTRPSKWQGRGSRLSVRR